MATSNSSLLKSRSKEVRGPGIITSVCYRYGLLTAAVVAVAIANVYCVLLLLLMILTLATGRQCRLLSLLLIPLLLLLLSTLSDKASTSPHTCE